MGVQEVINKIQSFGFIKNLNETLTTALTTLSDKLQVFKDDLNKTGKLPKYFKSYHMNLETNHCTILDCEINVENLKTINEMTETLKLMTESQLNQNTQQAEDNDLVEVQTYSETMQRSIATELSVITSNCVTSTTVLLDLGMSSV